jgi:hypothetical protein
MYLDHRNPSEDTMFLLLTMGKDTVYGTGMWWCLKSKTVPDFMAIIHVIIPVHTEYIPVHTGMYHFQHYVPVCTRYRPVHTGMYQKP